MLGLALAAGVDQLLQRGRARRVNITFNALLTIAHALSARAWELLEQAEL